MYGLVYVTSMKMTIMPDDQTGQETHVNRWDGKKAEDFICPSCFFFFFAFYDFNCIASSVSHAGIAKGRCVHTGSVDLI